MKCPTCEGVDLIMTDRQGVEIDYCPKCRGVWLDRGELDKLIERAGQFMATSAPHQSGPAAAPAQPVPHGYRRDDDDDDRRRQQYRDPSYGAPQKKRRGFLGEIFDWD